MTSIILPVLGVVLIIGFLFAFAIFQRLSAFRLVAPDIVPIDPYSLPKAKRDVIDHESGDLRHMGFRFHSAIHCNELSSEPTFHSTGWIFDHPDLPVVAILWLPDVSVFRKRNTGIEFLSWNSSDGFITSPVIPASKFPTRLHHKRCASNRIDQTLNHHLRRIGKLKPQERPFPPPASRIVEKIEETYRLIYEHNLKHYYSQPDSQGLARRKIIHHFAKTFQLLFFQPFLLRYLSSSPSSLGPFPDHLFPDEGRIPTDQTTSETPFSDDSPETDPTPSEIESYRKVARSFEQNHLSSAGKWTLLIVSALLFIGFFGGFFSLTHGVMLFLVILFHELGHVAAMRLMGYKDLQILFIPGIGALATGREKGAIVAWKKAFILLMGPIPGILLGFLLAIWTYRSPSEAFMQVDILSGILIFVNVFNLLPFHPLDGGQLLNTLIFNRWPYFKSLFFVLSSLLLVGTGYLLQSTFFMIIFALVGYISAQEAFRNAGILLRIRKTLPKRYDHGDEDMLLGRILPELRPKNLNDFKRYAHAKSLLTDLKTENAGVITTTLFLGFYTLPLWLPLVFILLGFAIFGYRIEEHRARFKAEGYPVTYAAFLDSYPNDQNALPLITEMIEKVETNPRLSEAFKRLEAIDQLTNSFPNGESMSDELREEIVHALDTPEIAEIDELIDQIKSKSFVFDPELKDSRIISPAIDSQIYIAFAMERLILSRALTQPEHAWEHVLEWINLVRVLDPVPLESVHSHPFGIIPLQFVDMASMIDRIATPPPEDLRVQIIQALERLKTPTPEEISIMRQYGIAVVADPNLDSYFQERKSSILSRIARNLPLSLQTRVGMLDNLRDLDPEAPWEYSKSFFVAGLQPMALVFDSSLRNMMKAMRKVGTNAIMLMEGVDEFMLLMQLGWKTHDHILLHGSPPDAILSFMGKEDRSSLGDSIIQNIQYQPEGAAFHLSISYQPRSFLDEIIEDSDSWDDGVAEGERYENESATLHWTGYAAIIPPPDPETSEDENDDDWIDP